MEFGLALALLRRDSRILLAIIFADPSLSENEHAVFGGK